MDVIKIFFVSLTSNNFIFEHQIIRSTRNLYALVLSEYVKVDRSLLIRVCKYCVNGVDFDWTDFDVHLSQKQTCTFSQERNQL